MIAIVRGELDTLALFHLKCAMHPSPRAPMEAQLIALEQRLRTVGGELAEAEQKIAARLEQGRPGSATAEIEVARLREIYWSIKRRCDELRVRGATPPTTPEDF